MAKSTIILKAIWLYREIIMKKITTITLTSLVFLFAGCTDDSTLKKKPEPVVMPTFNTTISVSLLMEHVITPAAFGIWNAGGFVIDQSGEHARSPKTVDEWEKVVNAASTLLESSNLLLLPSRNRDDKWTGFVNGFANIGERALAAAEKHDAKAINDIGDELVGICSGCHVAYGLPERL